MRVSKILEADVTGDANLRYCYEPLKVACLLFVTQVIVFPLQLLEDIEAHV
jgi:hypothetical protein